MMKNATTNKLSYEPALRQWWQRIAPLDINSETSLKAPSYYRAELKRCNSPDSALLTIGFRTLWFSLPETITTTANAQKIECWAVVAILLAYVKRDNNQTLAKAAGRKEGEKAVISELRFAQLQQVQSPHEFLRRARRILQQLKGEVSPILLARDIHQWFNEYYSDTPRKVEKRLIVRWAMDYYSLAAPK